MLGSHGCSSRRLAFGSSTHMVACNHVSLHFRKSYDLFLASASTSTDTDVQAKHLYAESKNNKSLNRRGKSSLCQAHCPPPPLPQPPAILSLSSGSLAHSRQEAHSRCAGAGQTLKHQGFSSCCFSSPEHHWTNCIQAKYLNRGIPKPGSGGACL